MIVIICGSRNFNNYDTVEKAIQQSGFDVSMVYSGHCKGVDLLGEMWAKEHNIPCKIFPAKWNDLKHPNALIKTRENPWTHKKEKYCHNAGNLRNEEMLNAGAEAVIAIQEEVTPGTQHMIRIAKKKGIPVYIYTKSDDEYEYRF